MIFKSFKASDCLVRLNGVNVGPLARRAFGARAIAEALRLVNTHVPTADVWCHWFEDEGLVLSTSRLARKVCRDGSSPELLVIDIDTAPVGLRPRTILRPCFGKNEHTNVRKLAA